MQDITVEELKERMDKGEKLNLVDVRRPQEFDEFNIGGKLIPIGDLPARLAELESMKDEEIILHCRSGNRSAQAKLFLEDYGFTKVRNLLGGLLEWQDVHGS